MEKKTKTVATNLKTLNKGLLEDYNDLRMGLIKTKEADSAANIAGKYIKALQTLHERQKYLGKTGNIPGLDD